MYVHLHVAQRVLLAHRQLQGRATDAAPYGYQWNESVTN